MATNLFEPGDKAVMHEEVAAELKRVAAVLRDVHPGAGRADVRKDDRRADLAGEAMQIAVVPCRTDVCEHARCEVVAILRASFQWATFKLHLQEMIGPDHTIPAQSRLHSSFQGHTPENIHGIKCFYPKASDLDAPNNILNVGQRVLKASFSLLDPRRSSLMLRDYYHVLYLFHLSSRPSQPFSRIKRLPNHTSCWSGDKISSKGWVSQVRSKTAHLARRSDSSQ